jgi:hypothetical protein
LEFPSATAKTAVLLVISLERGEGKIFPFGHPKEEVPGLYRPADKYFPDGLSLDQSSRRQTALVVSAHPDAIEIMAAGPILE